MTVVKAKANMILKRTQNEVNDSDLNFCLLNHQGRGTSNSIAANAVIPVSEVSDVSDVGETYEIVKLDHFCTEEFIEKAKILI